MNDVRMRNFIEDHVAYLLKQRYSANVCNELWNEYNRQAQGCRASPLWDSRWEDDSFGVEIWQA